MNVYELNTGRAVFVNPEFRDFAGACKFPSWFIGEVAPLLASSEPYAVAAGAGLIGRLTPFLAPNYDAVNRAGIVEDLPVWRVFEWGGKIASHYKNNIVESFLFEIEELIDCFQTTHTLYKRNSKACAAFTRMLKHRRDELEAVSFICVAMKQTEYVSETQRLDMVAQACSAYLNDDEFLGADRRLKVVRQHFPEQWWGSTP